MTKPIDKPYEAIAIRKLRGDEDVVDGYAWVADDGYVELWPGPVDEEEVDALLREGREDLRKGRIRGCVWRRCLGSGTDSGSRHRIQRWRCGGYLLTPQMDIRFVPGQALADAQFDLQHLDDRMPGGIFALQSGGKAQSHFGPVGLP